MSSRVFTCAKPAALTLALLPWDSREATSSESTGTKCS